MEKIKQLTSEYKDFFIKYKKQISFITIVIVAIFVRVYWFGEWPPFVNQDEASMGYDAWCILTTGKDRFGMSFPIHFVAWGSGQNALYAYLSIPFIAIFGLNTFSLRIVQLIFAVISIFVIYLLVKKFKGTRAGLLSMAILAISPWHIMLSHWGLESNIFPALFLIGIYFTALATEKSRYIYLAAFFFSLCLYSYGPAYLVVPVFAIICLIKFLIKKIIPIKNLIIAAGIFILLSTPIFLFILINALNLETINIGLLTIPKLPANRMSELFGLNIVNVVRNFLDIIIEQDDKQMIGVISGYGIFYLTTMPFVIFGIAKKEKKIFDFILLSATISSALLFFYYNNSVSINNMNSLYIPLMIYAGIGLSEVKDRKLFLSILCCYCLMFVMFFSSYFNDSYGDKIKKDYRYDLPEAISAAEELANGKEIYFIEETEFSAPYPMWTLYYQKISPKIFNSNLEYYKAQENTMFPKISHFSKYHFVYGEERKEEYKKDAVYIIHNDYLEEISDEEREKILKSRLAHST